MAVIATAEAIKAPRHNACSQIKHVRHYYIASYMRVHNSYTVANYILKYKVMCEKAVSLIIFTNQIHL